MRILCIDLSLHCGYAVLEANSTHPEPKLIKHGTLHYKGKTVKERADYPWSYIDVVADHVNEIMHKLVETEQADVIVIEETNKGKNRYSQKMLEFLHHRLLENISFLPFRSDRAWKLPKVVYLDTSAWRSTLGIWMSKEQKKINAKINKANREGGDKKAREVKKSLGVRGKFNKKHVAIAHANATFSLNLKVKDNDAADAICLGLAYLKGTTPSDGV